MNEAIVSAISPTSLRMDWKCNEIHPPADQLSVGGDYPNTLLAEQIFHSFGLMQIVAPLLPSVIKTDFPVLEIAKILTEEMYLSEGQRRPIWEVDEFEQMADQNNLGSGSVVTYSGGKDSMWNLMYAREMGSDPLAVHIKGLNKSVAEREYMDVLKQQELINFQLAVIELENSRLQHGQPSMRSRDVFLTAISIPLALEYDADKIYLEGGVSPDLPGIAFSYRASTWDKYNQLLRDTGMPIQMVGTDRGEIESIHDILMKNPDWMPLVSNCFTRPGLRHSVKTEFLKQAPSFPVYESQCGRCLKCRTTNLARVAYDQTVLTNTKKEDVAFFIKDTVKWLKKNKAKMDDVMDPGFEPLLHELREKYCQV